MDPLPALGWMASEYVPSQLKPEPQLGIADAAKGLLTGVPRSITVLFISTPFPIPISCPLGTKENKYQLLIQLSMQIVYLKSTSYLRFVSGFPHMCM